MRASWFFADVGVCCTASHLRRYSAVGIAAAACSIAVAAAAAATAAAAPTATNAEDFTLVVATSKRLRRRSRLNDFNVNVRVGAAVLAVFFAAGAHRVPGNDAGVQLFNEEAGAGPIIILKAVIDRQRRGEERFHIGSWELLCFGQEC